jgi:hypothetical protein
VLQLFIGKVIFTVLVPKFKLRGFSFTQGFLEGIKVIEVFCKTGTLVVIAFVNRAVFTVFPKIQRMVAMGTPEFRLVGKTAMKVKETVTDFALDLRTFFTVVEVEIL